MVGAQKVIINLWYMLLYALRTHIDYLFLENFYAELRKVVKKVSNFFIFP